VVVEMPAACQRQGDGQLGGTGVVHASCIAQDHTVGHVRQEVLHTCGQGLYHLELAHLADPVENLRALQVRQDKELNLGDRIGPAVTIGSIAVDVDTLGN